MNDARALLVIAGKIASALLAVGLVGILIVAPIVWVAGGAR